MNAPRRQVLGLVDGYGVGAVMAVALLDVTAMDEIRLPPAYAIGPAVAAVRNRAAAVLGTGAVALLVALLLAHHDGVPPTSRGVMGLVTIALVTLFCALAARVKQRHTRRLAVVAEVAHVAQEAILPTVPASREGAVRIASSYRSAADAASIGGDFHDVVPVRDGVRVLMGDVQGKGLEAAGAAASLLAAFRESAAFSQDLDEVGLRLSCALARRAGDDRFATAVLAQVTGDGRIITLNYGHPAPLLLRAAGGVQRAEPREPGLPLGLGHLDGLRPGRHEDTLGPGDRILFHTDGLTEARDVSGTFYPLDERTDRLRHGTPAQALSLLGEDVHAHTSSARAGADDDSALLLLQYDGSRGVPVPPRAPDLLTRSELGCDVCAVKSCPVAAELPSDSGVRE
ncbi:PP2C family protein-serine/threonine phosphatase [Streptomyces sp. NPDC094049]|uniref:PP2C family protein-serine/threonine phosphatase n=1 Tax=Streptomyces sp. NPDC094049 TaxID=3154987 RepID=UPI00332E378B